MRIAIYSGTAVGNNPRFKEESVLLATMLAKSGYDFVYGGSDSGLMGAAAEAEIAQGAHVIGVMPDVVLQSDVQPEGLAQLIEVATMSARRDKMIELADGFVALPGGIGTLDELSEVIVLSKMHILEGPIVILNVDGCYDALEQLFADMQANGFVDEDTLRNTHFATSAQEAHDIIRRYLG